MEAKWASSSRILITLQDATSSETYSAVGLGLTVRHSAVGVGVNTVS